MSDLAFVPPSLTAPAPTATAAEMAKRMDIAKTAKSFESSFLSLMMQQMFEGVETSTPFGGGQGETMFRSFMTDAFAKQMADRGGIGIADAVTKEMLKMQGLE
jgi:flagellar protein FlgJ